MWFLTGLPDREVAMFVKLHHTIGDGLARMTIISAFLDFAPGDAPSRTPALGPASSRLPQSARGG